MTLDDLKTEWKKDCPLDRLYLDDEIERLPKLHSKYLDILTDSNIKGHALFHKINKLKYLKRCYYMGDLDPAEVKERGWDQLDKRIIRSDIDMVLSADPEIIALNLQKSYQDEISSYATYVMKEIHSRQFQIKNLIEWRRFSEGG